MTLFPFGVSIAALRCRCGSSEVVAIRPGDAPVIDPATDILLSRGTPVVARCMTCLGAPAEPTSDTRCCYSCGATTADGAVFERARKPRGRMLVCTDCPDVPDRAPRLHGPVFVRGTYRAAERRRATSAQMDIEQFTERS